MADLNAWLLDNLALAFGVLAALVILLLIGFFVQSARLGRAVRDYRELVRGTDGSTLHDRLVGSAEQAVKASERMGRIEAMQALVEGRTQRSLQHIGLVRFNPFDDTWSDQSFVIALLDDARDGIVVSSLHGRANTRVFAKPVSNGESAHNLSDRGDPGDPHRDRGVVAGVGAVMIGAIDPEQRRVAERLVLAALRKFHHEQPLSVDLRVDSLVSRVRAAAGRKPPPRHRGSAPLTLEEAPELRRVIDEMAEKMTAGWRATAAQSALRMCDPSLDPEMEERVDRLTEGLRSAGASPPRVDGLAARLGIPPSVLDQLRTGGQLRPLAPGIDYPADVWSALEARIDGIRGPMSIARLRNELHTSRRHAEAILAARTRAPRTRSRS